MKLIELKKIIDREISDYPDREEKEVTILTNDPSVGPRSMVGVKYAGFGIDWESNVFVITANGSLTKKTQEQDIFDNAKELLVHLATNPKNNFFTRDSQRILKRFGYKDDDFIKYRRLFWETKSPT